MRKQILFLSAVFMINSTYAGVNYRYYEKNTSNGGVNGYSNVSETKGTIWVTLGTVERKCQYYKLDCDAPGNNACAFSVPPAHFYMPDVDRQVAANIDAGITTGQIYLNQLTGPGNADNITGQEDMPCFSWSQNGAVTKVVVLDQSEQ